MAKPKLISNEFRTSSLSFPSVEQDVNELYEMGDPLAVLLEIEERDGEITDDALDQAIDSSVSLRRL